MEDRVPSFSRVRQTCALWLVLTVAYVLTGCSPETGQAENISGGAPQAPQQDGPGSRAAERPNVILILSDDLDTGSISRMPNLRSLMVNKGTTFENAFVTDPLCCPSRATILRGQYAHNHKIVGNQLPRGGYKKFHRLGHESSTVATWLEAGGYRTSYFGKYLNDYRTKQVPPGWDEWQAVAGNYRSTRLNENGKIKRYDPETFHDTDVLSDKANGYLESTAEQRAPFFMFLAPRAPHFPATPAPRYADTFSDLPLPRSPSFNEQDVSDKPKWVRQREPLDEEHISTAQRFYRDRLRSMLSVDEMIGRLVRTLEDQGELDSTYLVFTSDNGFHMGQHRRPPGKWTPYEEDIRIPLIVRGPGVPAGRTLDHMVLNNDFAPTFADLAGVPTPSFVDGRSLKPLLTDRPPPRRAWRSAFLVEGASREEVGRPAFTELRTEHRAYVEYDSGERELYDLRRDPYELENRYAIADPALRDRLSKRLEALRECARESCREAENAP